MSYILTECTLHWSSASMFMNITCRKFFSGEFSLHLLQMSNMINRWNPCKGNNLNSASVHKYYTHEVLRQNNLMLRGSFSVVLKGIFCKHTLTKIALKPHIFMCVCCQMQRLSGYKKYNYLIFYDYSCV